MTACQSRTMWLDPPTTAPPQRPHFTRSHRNGRVRPPTAWSMPCRGAGGKLTNKPSRSGCGPSPVGITESNWQMSMLAVPLIVNAAATTAVDAVWGCCERARYFSQSSTTSAFGIRASGAPIPRCPGRSARPGFTAGLPRLATPCLPLGKPVEIEAIV